MANQPIPIPRAEAMMTQYVSYMKSLGVSDQTQYVIFTAKELADWLTEVLPFADEIRICEGLNLPDHEQAGKITVMLWPYKNGKPAAFAATESINGDPRLKPYNDGQAGP